METDLIRAMASQLNRLESRVERLQKILDSFGDTGRIQDRERLEGLLDPYRKFEPDPRKISVAEEFVLVDPKGKARARLAMEDGIRPMLALINEEGTRTNYFTLTDGGASCGLEIDRARKLF